MLRADGPNARSTSRPSSASRSRRCPSGSATSRSNRAAAAPSVEPPPAPPTPRQARRDRRVRPPRASSASACSPTTRSSPPAPRCTPARARRRDGKVTFANTNPAMIAFFCAWLRRFFAIDESRLRVRVYLHEGLDLDAAEQFWSEVTGVPRSQFNRAVPGEGRSVDPPEQARARLRLRRLLLLAHPPRGHGSGPGAASLGRHSGVAQSAEQLTVNP